jgi:ATP-dependent Clp protease ATP-binding subunit ClpC
LLQIFDDGHLTDAKGRRVDFRNSIIIMTSNVGAELIRKGTTLGFTSHADETKTQEQSHERMKENLLGELKKTFRPEFLNRIDGVVVFHSLTKENIRQIVDLMLASVSQQLAEKEIKLEVTDAAKDFLGEKGYDEVFGARPLRRVIQDMVEDKLSDSLLRGAFRAGDTAVVDLEGEEIVVHSPAVGALLGDEKP